MTTEDYQRRAAGQLLRLTTGRPSVCRARAIRSVLRAVAAAAASNELRRLLAVVDRVAAASDSLAVGEAMMAILRGVRESPDQGIGPVPVDRRLPLDRVVRALGEVARLKAENEQLRAFARSASDQAQKHIQDMWNPPGRPGPASAWSVLVSLGARAVVLLNELGEARTDARRS